jgi:hypothetical protein
MELLETDQKLHGSKVHANVGERTRAFKKFSDGVVELVSAFTPSPLLSF